MCSPLDPAQQKKAASLNEQILDYYYKFGQNRDLERYLRLRKSYSKSSSEGSLHILTEVPCTSRAHRSTPEIYELDTERSRREAVDYIKELEQCIASKSPNILHGDAQSLSPEKHESKIQTKSLLGKPISNKIFNFNCESNIAITLPSVSAQDSIPHDTVTESSQTDFDETLDKPNYTNEDENSGKQQTSPDTSVKYNKKLEWDSLGDVGYDKSSSSKSKNQSNSMSSLERKVLKHFFADRGIEINFLQRNNRGRLPEIQEGKIIPSPITGTVPKAIKEKWRETLESVKKKYSTPPPSSILKKDFKKIPSKSHSTPKEQNLEKFCQTSFIKTQCKEVQVDSLSFDKTETGKSEFDITTPSSFEFFAQPRKVSTNSDKENITPSESNLNTERKLKDCAKLLLENKNSSKSTTSNDLELGVKLLCSLIESKSLNENQKKSLAKKIVTKITKKQLQLSSTTSSELISSESLITSANKSTVRRQDMSGVRTISSGTSTMDSVKSKLDKNNKDFNYKNVIGIEEIDQNQVGSIDSISSTSEYQNIKSSEGKLTPEENNIYIPSSESYCSHSKGRSVSEKPLPVKEIPNKNAESAEQNETMHEWLDPITQSELKYDKKKKFKSKEKTEEINMKGGGDCEAIRSPKKVFEYIEKERKTHINWIENEIKHLENLKNLLITNDGEKFHQKIIASSLTEKSKVNEYDNVAESPKTSSTGSSLVTQNETYQEIRRETEKDIINPERHTKKNLKKTKEQINYAKTAVSEKHESKIAHQTKTTTFSLDKEKRFPKVDYKIPEEKENKRNKDRSKLETPQSGADESVRSFARQRKQEFLENYKNKPEREYDHPAVSDHYSEPRDLNRKPKFTKNDAYTSVTSSEFFISSESISIPGTGTSSTTTTTHQYDSRVGVGIQTTDSLLRTVPIFGPPSNCQCNNPFGCFCPRPTIRVYNPGSNKEAQVKPQSVAYVINFERIERKPEGDKNSGGMTLRDHLEKTRPEFGKRINERQKVLKKIHKLRNEREEKIRNIIDNTSMNSISRKLDELPPPPTKYTRIFPTKEMKAMTKRKYRKLPEVIEKAEREKVEKRKKSNKVLADMFNRRLQRQVHKGKLSLEHSLTVI